ncbi:terpene synthase family protein [Tenacibaculum salmonis]|uniref:terpene synthase family protein n=1 Tax=Tenacibaculum sp. P3-BQ1 TaxID=3232310 RepID=UPI0034DF7B27
MNFSSTSLSISKTKLEIHKDAKLILKEAKAISKKLGVIDDDLYKHHTTMTNHLYIDTPIHKMINAVVTYDVLYFIDDFFGEDTASGVQPDFKKILDIWTGKELYLNSENSKISNLYNAIFYISDAVKKDSPSYFFDKYTESITEHLSYSLKSVPFTTVDEYIYIRLYTGGMFPVIDLIEYMHSIYLSPEIINKVPSIKKMREQCALIGALSNDLFSYAKEKHSDYNLINAYLISNEADNYNDAVNKSIIKVNTIHTEYEATLLQTMKEATFLSSVNNNIVLKYIDALNVIISSSYHWQKNTKRYIHPENVFEDMKV